MFAGRFVHSIDEKNRLTIPAKFRALLSEGVVVTIGLDGCLWLFPQAHFEKLSERLSELSITDSSVREFRRDLYGDASTDPLDKQGRLNLPEHLLEYAHLDKQAMIVGQWRYCEIWAPKAWQERWESSHSNPDARAAMFSNLVV